MIKFMEVGVFPEEEFGLRNLNFTIENHERVHFQLEHNDQLTSFLGLLEGRYTPQKGILRKSDKLRLRQSDELLFGGKVYDETVERYWAMGHSSFLFDGHKKQKLTFIDKLNARHLRHFVVHRLRGQERLRFVLLSLLFQEQGLILIHRLLLEELDEMEQSVLNDLHRYSSCLICYFSIGDEGQDRLKQLHEIKPIREVDWAAN